MHVEDEVVVLARAELGSLRRSTFRPPRLVIRDRPISRTDAIVRIGGYHPLALDTQSGRVDCLDRLNGDRFVTAGIDPDAHCQIGMGTDRDAYL
jgi:hypothetical protein